MDMNKKLVWNKAAEGSIEAMIAVSIVGVVKTYAQLDPMLENSLTVLLATVLVGASRGVRNFLKHRKDGK